MSPLKRDPLAVLLVDDDSDLLEALGLYLETAGLKVMSVSDGYAAVEAARRQRPDVMVMDFAMPGLDGLGVVDILQRRQDTAGIPIVFFTGWPAEGLCKARPMDACVQKPSTPDRLLWVVRMAAAKASAFGI